MSKNTFSPNLKTPVSAFCREELNKLNSGGMLGDLAQDLRDLERQDLKWESEQLAKSYGAYLEFDRAKTGSEKDWRYMIRLGIPGGGPISPEAWRVVDDLAEDYTRDSEGRPSIRLTNRQNIQFHWVKKEQVIPLIQRCAHSGLLSLNGCGDNTRNIMGCPLARFSDVFNSDTLVKEAAQYFQLPAEPFIKIFEVDSSYLRTADEKPHFKYGPALLNRKFKIAFGTVHRDPTTGILFPDNCVELRTNDLGIAPIFEKDEHVGYQVYVGGGQGEKNGKPTMATLSVPFAKVEPQNLLPTLSAVVSVHQEWGDRENRHWARLKYVIKSMGVEWLRQQVEEKLGYKLALPDLNFDPGARMLHHGWTLQPSNQLYTFGAFLENGRISNRDDNGALKTAVRTLIDKYRVELAITPNQDLLFQNLQPEVREEFLHDLQSFGWGKRRGQAYSKLRLLSGACVGRDTCRLTYTDSEKFEPELLDQLEDLGWGDLTASIGITGCERQCFRPGTKSIGLVGSGFDRYQLKLFGSEDGRHQGQPLYSADQTLVYLRSVPRDQVAVLLDALFRFYREESEEDEELGAFYRRIGSSAIIERLGLDEKTSDLIAHPQEVKALLEPNAKH